jgi:hypothetical protein
VSLSATAKASEGECEDRYAKGARQVSMPSAPASMALRSDIEDIPLV